MIEKGLIDSKEKVKVKNDNFKRNPFLSFLLSQQGFLIILIIVISVIAGILNNNFFKLQNIINVLQQNAALGIIAAGLGLVLITGNFDISIGPMLSLLGIILGIIISSTGNVFLAVVSVIVISFILGIINGTIVSKSKAASFIITLGLMVGYRGLALVVSQGYNFPLQGKLTWFGRGYILKVVPVPIFIFILILILSYAILRFTKFGRLLYAVGGSEKAAYFSGVNVDLIKILAYGLCGLTVGIGTLIIISRLGVAYPNTGDRYSLDTLAAIVVGGYALSGGKGSALSTLLGVITFGLITNILNIVKVNPYWRDVVVACIIIIAVVVGQIGSKRD